ncbi:MAG: hypothetical protein FWE95_03245 [Planctomycetaceae bacterium]|nr:hypothetical protein [Planctomycetaceae bacterium]
MSIEETLDAPFAVDFTGANPAVSHLEGSPLIDQLSEPIVGKWNVLVSQTNWEKGALILRWRNELVAAGLPNTVYSDDAWARRVGNVSPQHVGRLRRVAERFGENNRNFSALYWSHFHAALEWDDAELWLEGAVHNDWSVAQMRMQRWEALGGTTEQKPREEDVFVVEIDEDAYSRVPSDRIEGRTVEIGAVDAVEGFDASSVTTPVSTPEPPKKKKEKTKIAELDCTIPATGEILMSLKGVAEFPVDLAESLELLKVAILNHKLAGWKSISAEHVCRSLDNLKMLAVSDD